MSAYIGASPPRELALPVSRTNHSALRWKTASQAWGGWSARPMPRIMAAATTPPPRAHDSVSQARSSVRRRRSPATVTPAGSVVVPSTRPRTAARTTAPASPASRVASDHGTPRNG
ncbi:hypothetical protein BJF81_10115 [Ornithinimicrobium sp. CNJ-824]|nr:hypothetical protein BJF81_10115 [Ornithinimicrobium sp. CNJ-824]